MTGITTLLNSLQKYSNEKDLPAFEITLPDGTTHRINKNSNKESAFKLRVINNQGLCVLKSLDDCLIGETYMNGHIDVLGSFYDVLDLRRVFSDHHPLQSL